MVPGMYRKRIGGRSDSSLDTVLASNRGYNSPLMGLIGVIGGVLEASEWGRLRAAITLNRPQIY